MKSPFSIATILALITSSNGQLLRTSSEDRVLLASASDSTIMGPKEDHLSSHHTQGLSSGRDSKSHGNDITSQFRHGDIHEVVKPQKEMATSKCLSWFSHAEKRVPKDPTEVMDCVPFVKLQANCKEKWSLSSSKTHERQLMESNCCGTPRIEESSRQCANCGSRHPPAEVTQTTPVGYPAFPYQQNAQDQSRNHYGNPSYRYAQPDFPSYASGQPIPNQQNRPAWGSFLISGVNPGTPVAPPPMQAISPLSRSNSPQRTGEQAAIRCCACWDCCTRAATEAACCCIVLEVCDCITNTAFD